MSDETRTPWWHSDAVIFAALLAMAAVGFALTYFTSKAYARREDSLARRWYRQGESDLAANRPKAAIADFRTALLYSRDNAQYRLRLAYALAANDNTQQAIAYFLNLWEEQPASGPYNLELARLYARVGQIRPAMRYYNGAVYGIWPSDPLVERRRARIEYIHFLLRQNQRSQAQAEAITLAAAVPPSDIAGRFQAADMLITTGDLERAYAEYVALEKSEPARAELGAGKAAFQLGWYRTAAGALNSAIEHGVNDPDATMMLAQSQQVLKLDSLERGIGGEERARRVSTAYVQAGARLQQCAAQQQLSLENTPATADLQRLYGDWKAAARDLPGLRRDSDRRDAVMDLVYRIENATARQCGEPTSGPDWALLTLARNGEGVQR